MKTHKVLSGICWLLFSFQVQAHHSRAEFTGDVIELEGELVDVRWSNPHPTFKIRLFESSDAVWDIQAYGGIGQLRELGFDTSRFEPGVTVTFAGLASSRRSRMLLANNMRLPDGLEVVLKYNGLPYWNGPSIGGSGSVEIDKSVLANAATENRGLFRVWSVESTEIAVRSLIETMRNASFTEIALAATADWDLTDNPITRCEPSWMPHTMIQPVPLELIDNGDTLTLNNAYFSSSRTIFIDGEPSGQDQLPSRMGVSKGRWENGSLVIETDHISAPSFNGDGVLQSDQMQVVERFTLSDDQSVLNYEMVMTDSVALNEPATYKTYYLALGQEFPESLAGGNCGL